MLKRIGRDVVLISVSVITTIVVSYIWSAPATIATKSEVSTLVSEAKAEAKADYYKLDDKKLDKDTFASYVKQDGELRDLIVERQNAQHSYIIELQKRVHR